MRSFLGVPIVASAEVIGAFYLTEKEGGRDVRRGRSGADRAARRARRDRDHQRAPVRAQPGALDPVRAQPARARAARRRQPEAVQPDADRRGGGDPARPRSRRRASPARAAASARARGARRAAIADPRAASARARARRPGRRAAQGGRDARAACTASTIELTTDGASEAAGVADRTSRCCGSSTRRSTTRSAMRAPERVSVLVGVVESSGALVVEVDDDGVGFDPGRAELRSRHLGLTSMEERARELGGRLEIRSAPGAGTTVRLEVPDVIRRCCSSTTTRSCARDCGRSSSSRTDSRWSARRRTARRPSSGRSPATRRDPDGSGDAEARRRRRDARAASRALRAAG